MIPTRRALALLAGWTGLGVLASFLSSLAPAWQGAGAALGAALLADGLGAWRTAAPSVRREMPAALPLRAWAEVRVRLESRARRRLRLRVHDHHPPGLETRGLPHPVTLPPGEPARLAYPVRPRVRGLHRFGPVQVRLAGPLGLLERSLRLRVEGGAPDAVRVYPDFRGLAGRELRAAARRTAGLGVHRRRRRGEGLEFHQLREYRPGDPLRQIDWKATARLRRAVAREYQDERDQQVIFLLDCGRRLRARSGEGELDHFDASLDAMLQLASLALRQGDAVGLMTFAGPRRWLAPRKGLGQATALLNATYDLEAGHATADYPAAARDLLARIRKRALVVVLSNLRDDDAEELAASLRLLRRHHRVLLASLREPELGAALRSPVRQLPDALRNASVHLYLEARQRALAPLARSGALLLEGEPAELPAVLVQGYIELKAAGAL